MQKIIQALNVHLNVPKSTVYDAIQRFKELGTNTDRFNSDSPTTLSTTKMVDRIRKRAELNSTRSMRQMTR